MWFRNFFRCGVLGQFPCFYEMVNTAKDEIPPEHQSAEEKWTAHDCLQSKFRFAGAKWHCPLSNTTWRTWSAASTQLSLVNFSQTDLSSSAAIQISSLCRH